MNEIELMQHKSDDEPRFLTLYPNKDDPIKRDTYNELSLKIHQLEQELGVDEKSFLFSKGKKGEPDITLSQEIDKDFFPMHIRLWFKDRVVDIGFRTDAGTVSQPNQPAAHLYATSKGKINFRLEEMYDVPESAVRSLIEVIGEREINDQFEKRISKPRRMILMSQAA
jgi:hypothetical protein